MANVKHIPLLKQGTAIWNDWKKRNLGSVADFSWANRNGTDLDGTDLSGTNLNAT